MFVTFMCCTRHSVFQIECCGRLGARLRAVSRTTSDYSEPRSHESPVLNFREEKTTFPLTASAVKRKTITRFSQYRRFVRAVVCQHATGNYKFCVLVEY